MIILHITGPSFVGKSTYIANYLSKDIIFDVKAVYSDLRKQKRKAFKTVSWDVVQAEIMHVLDLKFAEAQQAAADHQQKFLVVETSGINQTINRYLRSYDWSPVHVFTILIWTPKDTIEARIKENVEAGALDLKEYDPRGFNEKFWSSYYMREIKYDTRYLQMFGLHYPPFNIEELRQRLQ
jgi:hypothetical protein